MIEQLRRLPNWLRITLYFPLAFLNGWLLFLLISSLEPLVSILVTSALLAFLLNFPIDFLVHKGVRRSFAIFIVLFLGFIVLLFLAVMVFPLLITQLNGLINSIPNWLDRGTEHIEYLKKWAVTQKYSNEVKDLLLNLIQKLSTSIQTLTNQVMSILLSVINSLIMIFSVIVLTVFLVINGSKIWDGIFTWIPQNSLMKKLVRETFGIYFVTQAMLAGILSISQTILFTILGVPYSLLFGLVIGLSTFIPFASMLNIIIISILLSLNNLWLGLKVLFLAFFVSQINDQIISPRLMSGMTGLNPVWLIIALFVGGKFGGVLGLIVAVPLASISKNVVEIIRQTEQEKEM